MSNNCFVCDKHQNLTKLCGGYIASKNGLILSHFPYLADEIPTKGHLLIEPNRHITDLADLNTEEAVALGEIIQKAVRCLKDELGAEHVYMFRINDKVPHLHVHLVPRYANTPREYWGLKITEWPARNKANQQDVYELTTRLKNSFSLEK